MIMILNSTDLSDHEVYVHREYEVGWMPWRALASVAEISHWRILFEDIARVGGWLSLKQISLEIVYID